MNGFVVGVTMLVSATGVSPVVETPRRSVLPSAFIFDLPAAETMESPPRSTTVFQTSQPHDSLKNGAIIGAVIGAATGAVMAAFGCMIIRETEGETPDSPGCVGPAVFLVGTGAGLGAAIGVGVDAMFERGPSATLPAGGRRTVFRVRFKF
jgi:hypothetical protein